LGSTSPKGNGDLAKTARFMGSRVKN